MSNEDQDRYLDFENITGKLLVAQANQDQIQHKIISTWSGEDWNTSTRYIKIREGWYRLDVSLRYVSQPNFDSENINHNFENIIGQLMVTDYQIHILRRRLADMTDTLRYKFQPVSLIPDSNPENNQKRKKGKRTISTIKTSAFTFKNKSNWYKVKIESMPLDITTSTEAGTGKNDIVTFNDDDILLP
jgi:hypothetical protein